MSEDGLCTIEHIFTLFHGERIIQTLNLPFCFLFEAVTFWRPRWKMRYFKFFGVVELIMDIEVGLWHDLEERLSVEIDVVEFWVLLIVDIGVCETSWGDGYALEMISPLEFDCSCLLRFTPWIRMISPHLSVFCYCSDIDIYLNKL